MAYALAPYLCKLKLCRIDFPEDVAELIDGMLDWRYELVRGGGTTPSASRMNPCPPCKSGGMLTDHMDTGKEYIVTFNMPEFGLNHQECVPNSELHPGSRWRSRWEQAPTTISLFRYVLKQPRYPGEDKEWDWRPGEREWRTVRKWTPGSFPVKHRVRLGGA